MTESDSTSTDLGQALLDLQSQLEEVIQDFESETGEELSGEAEERRRVRITSLRESLKNDLDELQNQVALRVSQLEDRLSLLEIVIEGKNQIEDCAGNAQSVRMSRLKRVLRKTLYLVKLPRARSRQKELRTNYSIARSVEKANMKFTN